MLRILGILTYSFPLIGVTQIGMPPEPVYTALWLACWPPNPGAGCRQLSQGGKGQSGHTLGGPGATADRGVEARRRGKQGPGTRQPGRNVR